MIDRYLARRATVARGSPRGDLAKEHVLRPELLLQGAHAFLATPAAGGGERRLDLLTATVRARW